MIPRIPILVMAIGLLAGCATPGQSAEPIDSLTATATEAPTATATEAPTATATATASPEPVGVMIAAGDIAACDEEGDSATAALIAELEGTVATLGDNVYPHLGCVPGSDAAGHREPRLRLGRRRRVLPLLRRGGGNAGRGLVLV
jgi:hypothetical protein